MEKKARGLSNTAFNLSFSFRDTFSSRRLELCNTLYQEGKSQFWRCYLCLYHIALKWRVKGDNSDADKIQDILSTVRKREW
jgi:hypothetical protein